MSVSDNEFDNHAHDLMHEYGFAPDESIMYEGWYSDDDVRYFVFASFKIPTSAIIQFHADQLPH